MSANVELTESEREFLFEAIQNGDEVNFVQTLVASRLRAERADLAWRLRSESDSWPDAADVLIDLASEYDR